LGGNPQADSNRRYKFLKRIKYHFLLGKAKKVPTAESKEYFQSRSKASQAGSAASPQSKIVESREWLWQRNEELLAKDEIPMPNWGGYSVEPDWIEFWQGNDI
jgi:pyridoxamine 5'-phosphate oxidase